MVKRKPKPAAAGPDKTTVTVRCPRPDSFRVQQVAGMFDLQLPAECVEQFAVELPTRTDLIDGRPWQIGCIVGPSGSGKSSVARQAFGQELYSGREWPTDRAVVDCFELPEDAGDQLRSIRDITGMLTAVGFSSPPSWIKPYAVLSNGEKFRCDLARAILEAGNRSDTERLVVFDEFTSVVDRTVAKVGSAAVAKAIRRMPGLRFVAVTCHYDVVEWLAPDWVLDMQSQSLTRGSLRRPGVDLEIRKGDRSCWPTFARHHYLNNDAPAAASYYVACVDGRPASIVVTTGNFGRVKLSPGFVGVRRIARVVTLPDFQGVGIGGVLLDTVAEILAAERMQALITTSHPAMIARLRSSPCWRVTRFAFGGPKRGLATAFKRGIRDDRAFRSAGQRYILSAKYAPPKNSEKIPGL